MSQQELQVTKSHLFRQLLQSRVEILEHERSQMKRQINHLERRLTHSTARHAALSGGGMQKVIAQTMVHVRGLRERAEAEADFTLKITQPKQEQLFREMERLREECTQLNQMMDEMIEGVHAISEQTQSSTGLLIQDATFQQEQLISELDHLYDENGMLRMAIVDARKHAFNVQERARTQREYLDAKAQAERERLFGQSEALLHESQKLHGALLSATEAAHTIQRWTQLDAAQAALELYSATEGKHIRESSDDEEERAQDEEQEFFPINEEFVLEAARAAIREAEEAEQTSDNLSHSSPQRLSQSIISNVVGSSSLPSSMNASHPRRMQALVLSLCLCLVVVLALAISSL